MNKLSIIRTHRVPRPEAKACFVGGSIIAVMLISASPAIASQPLAPLLACRNVTSSAARLACFDQESATLAKHAATASGTCPATAGVPASAGLPASASNGAGAIGAPGGARASHGSALDPMQTFGLPPGKILAREQAAQKVPRPLDHIEAYVVTLAAAADGREIFTLDNHQVWEQLEPEGNLYMNVKPGEAVEISRGWLGSYSLSTKSKRSCKVTRLR